jgi:peptidyl-prolyl cis-trans isomerase D
VQTQFGWHLIKLDRKRGDTLDLRHILIDVGQSDSSATATDRLADRLSSIGANATEPALFDSAAAELGLQISSVVAIEGEPLQFAGRYVPSMSAWAFSGVTVGESSELQDSPEAYYLARLDSIRAGGIAPLEDVRDDIRRRLERTKRVEALLPLARQLATSARQSSLEAAAQQLGQPLEQTSRFARGSLVPGLGQFNEAVGAAFGLDVGEISAPVKTMEDIFVLRLDEFTPADSAAFVAGLPMFRAQTVEALKSERVQQYLVGLREAADIKDDRQEIRAKLRRQVPI